MDAKKDQTKHELANCFKKLVLTVPFEKITIKMITDAAGVIRPTFYKHFQDKYEVVEWIFEKDIAEKVNVMIENNMEYDAILLLCICIEKEKPFYRKAYKITGPNSFEHLLEDFIYRTFLRLLKKYPLKSPEKLAILSDEGIASYYTFGLADTIKKWVITDDTHSCEQLCEAYHYLLRHSLLDLLNRNEKEH